MQEQHLMRKVYWVRLLEQSFFRLLIQELNYLSFRKVLVSALLKASLGKISLLKMQTLWQTFATFQILQTLGFNRYLIWDDRLKKGQSLNILVTLHMDSIQTHKAMAIWQVFHKRYDRAFDYHNWKTVELWFQHIDLDNVVEWSTDLKFQKLM